MEGDPLGSMPQKRGQDERFNPEIKKVLALLRITLEKRIDHLFDS